MPLIAAVCKNALDGLTAAQPPLNALVGRYLPLVDDYTVDGDAGCEGSRAVADE